MNNIEKFKTDIVREIFNAFDDGGITYDSSKSDYRSVMLNYLTMITRLIGPKKRCVHVSKELNNKISGIDSKSTRLKALVDDIKTKIESGADVNGHLSKRIFTKLDETDKMLDDWNIYHLHLCFGNPDVFDLSRIQSGDLLMAVILYNDAYFIDVTNHSNDDWYDVSYLEIIKNNWEGDLLIRHDEIIDVPNLDESVAAIKNSRKSNVNSIIHKIGNSYYTPKFSLGYSFGGTSMKAMTILQNLNRFLCSLDFDYDHIDFQPYCTNSLGFVCDKHSNEVPLDIILP